MCIMAYLNNARRLIDGQAVLWNCIYQIAFIDTQFFHTVLYNILECSVPWFTSVTSHLGSRRVTNCRTP